MRFVAIEDWRTAGGLILPSSPFSIVPSILHPTLRPLYCCMMRMHRLHHSACSPCTSTIKCLFLLMKYANIDTPSQRAEGSLNFPRWKSRFPVMSERFASPFWKTETIANQPIIFKAMRSNQSIAYVHCTILMIPRWENRTPPAVHDVVCSHKIEKHTSFR